MKNFEVTCYISGKLVFTKTVEADDLKAAKKIVNALAIGEDIHPVHFEAQEVKHA